MNPVPTSSNQPFFNSPTQCARLQLEVSGWIGTPFVPGCGGTAAKGVRADCTWVAAPLQRLGAIGAVAWPKRYVVHGGGPAMLEVLIRILSHTPRLLLIWQRGRGSVDLMAGDVIVTSTGSRLHHLSLSLGNNLIAHCWQGKVRLGSSGDHVKLWHSIYRPFAPFAPSRDTHES